MRKLPIFLHTDDLMRSMTKPKHWRNLTLHIESTLDEARLFGITNVKHVLDEKYGYKVSDSIFNQLTKNITHRKGVLTFEWRQAKRNKSLNLQRMLSKIRKQDEAAQVAADSSR